jgi:RNA polymerase sigma factor (sigma-70 family)
MPFASPAIASHAIREVHDHVVGPKRTSGRNATTRTISLENARLRALARSAQAGDTRAYAELLGAITPRIRQIISNQRRFLQRADIEDIVQEVLLSLHAVRGTYDPERPFMPWLIAITEYRLADAARRYYRDTVRQNEIGRLSVTPAEEMPNTEAERFDDRDALRQAIERLPPRQREAIRLLKLREMSLKEAARASGTSVDALKVAACRAMATLRRTLKI